MKNSEIAEKVYQLSAQSREIDAELAKLKLQLKKIGSGKYGEYLVSIDNAERETFQLKEAKTTLTPSVWEKIKAFVKNTEYQVVRVIKI